MKFDNDRDYLQALNEEIADKSGGDIGKSAELQRDFALERCISRFNPKEVAVKGGYGVRTIAEPSPFTKDVDMVIDKPEWEERSRDGKTEGCVEYVYDALEQASQDGFKFEPKGWIQIHDERVNTPLARVPVKVTVAGQPFTEIEIDVGLKPENMPVEVHSGRDLLSFAEVENPVISTASKEFLVADKLSLVFENGMDRPRDLVHASLLLENEMDNAALFSLMEELAQSRNVESKLTGVIEPTQEWLDRVQQICDANELKTTAVECFERLNNLLDRFNNRDRSTLSVDHDAGDSRSEPGSSQPKQALAGDREQPGNTPVDAKSFIEAVRSDVDKGHSQGDASKNRSARMPGGKEFAQHIQQDRKSGPCGRQQGMNRTAGIDRSQPTPGEGRGEGGSGRTMGNTGQERGTGYGGVSEGGFER